MSIALEKQTVESNGATAHVLEVVRSAEQELGGLLQRRLEIVARINALRQLMNDMVTLFGESILDEELRAEMDRRLGGGHRPGFTRACRAVLTGSCGPLRAREASAELRRRFPEMAGRHKDLTASVTTVFHRFVRYEEARCFLDGEGVRVWQWLVTNRGGASAQEVAVTFDGDRQPASESPAIAELAP